MMPIHRLSTPVSPNEMSKAVRALSNVLFIIAGNTSVLPIPSCTKAIRNAIAKKPIHI